MRTISTVSVQLLVVMYVILLGLCSGNPIHEHLDTHCSCESERHVKYVRHRGATARVTQHHCVLKVEGSSNDEAMLEEAPDCCCIATFEVEKLRNHIYHTRVPSDGCELVPCSTM